VQKYIGEPFFNAMYQPKHSAACGWCPPIRKRQQGKVQTGTSPTAQTMKQILRRKETSKMSCLRAGPVNTPDTNADFCNVFWRCFKCLGLWRAGCCAYRFCPGRSDAFSCLFAPIACSERHPPLALINSPLVSYTFFVIVNRLRNDLIVILVRNYVNKNNERPDIRNAEKPSRPSSCCGCDDRG